MKIAIAGFGLEGRANYEYWNTPENDLTIADEREGIDVPNGAKTLLGAGAFEKLRDFDMVIRTAGLSPHKIKTDGKIWSATNEFFAKCPATIIGVTGTKGKGTTCSLIVSLLKAAGKTVHLVGNIGTPALEVLPKIQPDDIVVYEMSSFQLWDIGKSPHVAVVLMIEADHLDVHTDMEEYIGAKANIAVHQAPSDIVIFNKNNEYSRYIAEQSRGEKIEYPFAIDEFVSSLKIPGVHNQENASAAIAAAREFGVGDDEIREGLASFQGLPHRLELVRTLEGVAYYDDSFSSATPAVKVAIKSFTQPIILIAGGFDRGLDYAELGAAINATGNIKKVLLIGQTKEAISRYLKEGTCELFDTLDAATERAHDIAESGDVVLLSPGCASFDMFKNFTDRGDQFREVVNAL